MRILKEMVVETIIKLYDMDLLNIEKRNRRTDIFDILTEKLNIEMSEASELLSWFKV